MPSPRRLLHRAHPLSPGQGLPWLAPGRAPSLSGKRRAQSWAQSWAGAGTGPADKALLCRAEAAGSPVNSRIILGGGPPAFPAAAAPRERRGRRCEAAVVLGGQGRAGCRDLPATAWLGAAGCCRGGIFLSRVPPALGAGWGAGRLGGHPGTPVAMSLRSPTLQALPVPMGTMAGPRCWALLRGRDKQVGGEGLTSAPGAGAGAGAAGPASAACRPARHTPLKLPAPQRGHQPIFEEELDATSRCGTGQGPRGGQRGWTGQGGRWRGLSQPLCPVAEGLRAVSRMLGFH